METKEEFKEIKESAGHKGWKQHKEKKKVLIIRIVKRYFDLIASGQKTMEYREMKDYWKKRLENKQYEFVKFINGYSKNSPELLVEYKGLEFPVQCVEYFREKDCYGIKLGEIKEISNYEKPKQE